jgi:CRISPR/Cas system-associated protein Cas10 (large subunit of type III CRISPR-Cas system)
LRKAFEDGFSDIETNNKMDKPTLSVGLAIGHIMEDLHVLLNDANIAEKTAKNGTSKNRTSKENERNALAVFARSRGNAENVIRAQWNEDLFENSDSSKKLNISQSLDWLISEFLDDKISNSIPYEIDNICKFYETWDKQSDSPARHEIERLLNRKKVDKKTTDLFLKYLNRNPNDYENINSFKQILLISSWVSRALRGDLK